jgi:glycosyltransferase involved in cell wall biosynthesis
LDALASTNETSKPERGAPASRSDARLPDAPRSPTNEEAIELTIVMPCLDEAETLAACLHKARRFLEQSGIAGELIVADNGSSDGSQSIATELGARVVDVHMRGYGAALYYGTRAARGRYVVMGDSDDSYDFSVLQPFVDKLREGYDLVMGNRFRGGIKPGAMPWKNRYLGNPVLSTIGKMFFRAPVDDFHCGLRGFSKAAFENMDLRTTGMEYASEMVIKATLGGMRMCEVPTTLSPDGRSRPPHLRPWRDGWRHLRFMLVYSPRWLFVYPGLLLMLAGLLLAQWIATGPRYIGNVGLDVNTLVYACMTVLVGFQCTAFGALSSVFAVQQGLVPATPRFNKLFSVFNLELGIILSALLLAVGLMGSVAAFYNWQLVGFGPLDARVSLRIVIPSATAIALSIQMLCNSFFASVLGLSVRTFHSNE